MFKLARVLTLPLVVTFALAACAGSGDTPAKSNEQDAERNASEPIAGKPLEGEGRLAVAPPAGESGKEYALQIEPGEATAGQESTVNIRVIPQGGWKLNLGYPTKLEITPPEGTAVAKPKQAVDDALKLDEDSCEFAVAFTPEEAGEKTFTGEVKFAVCQAEACVPKTEKIEFKVAVK